MWTKLLADSIDEQLDPPTPPANVDVEPLFVDEQFPQLAEETPTGPLVERFRADVLDVGLASRALHWVRIVALCHSPHTGGIDLQRTTNKQRSGFSHCIFVASRLMMLAVGEQLYQIITGFFHWAVIKFEGWISEIIIMPIFPDTAGINDQPLLETAADLTNK